MTFPSLVFKTLAKDKIELPRDIPTNYAAILFYRGHWWPFCNRQLAEWQSAKKELEQLGVTVYAASVDTPDQATEVVTKNNLTFTMIHSVEKRQTESIGVWWGTDHHGEYSQPAEFLLDANGKILGSLYASGPIGRMSVSEAIKMIKFTEMRKNK